MKNVNLKKNSKTLDDHSENQDRTSYSFAKNLPFFKTYYGRCDVFEYIQGSFLQSAELLHEVLKNEEISFALGAKAAYHST